MSKNSLKVLARSTSQDRIPEERRAEVESKYRDEEQRDRQRSRERERERERVNDREK